MKKVKLEEIAEIISGLSYRRYLDENGEKFQVIVQRSIKKDGKLTDFEEMSLKSDIKERYFSRKNDVLMKMPYPYEVVCIKEDGLIISDRIAIIRLNEGYDPDFITHILTNAHIKKQLHKLGSREKISHTSIKEIKQLELVVPDFETQKKYGELLNTINDKIHMDSLQVEYDQRLKEAILNDLWEDE